MVILSASPDLSVDALKLFHTVEPLLGDAPILVFRGSASTAAAPTISSSRIQIHVFTAAGFQSYSRLAISPSSPLYAAVNCLSREEQGDEVCRELAYGLYKYFSELPQEVREQWERIHHKTKKNATSFALLTDQHAAHVASRMTQVEDIRPVIEDVKSALASKSISYQDMDVILPPGSITDSTDGSDTTGWDTSRELRFGKYAELVSLLGEPAFLPTSRMRRAPSRPTAQNHSVKYTHAQKEALRREMCELVDTEESYVEKLQELLAGVAANTRIALSRGHNVASTDKQNVGALFPPSLDAVREVNAAFMQDVRKLFDETETGAIDELRETAEPDVKTKGTANDSIGVLAFAKCLLDHLPRFKDPYMSYIRAHEKSGQAMKLLVQQGNPEISSRLREAGEKRLTSLLIEPVQRLPRYSLYVENMSKHLPVQHPALKHLLKAKDHIAEICATKSSSSDQSQTLSRLREFVGSWPTDFIPKSRLITTVDLIELHAPYNISNFPEQAASLVGLLFAEAFVVLERPYTSSLTARSLLSKIDNSITANNGEQQQDEDVTLIFNDFASLQSLRVTETQNDRVVQLSSRWPKNDTNSLNILDSSTRHFYLCGQYEGRASKFVKDFVRARIEGRFPEQQRESSKWEARELGSTDTRLGLFTALFEEDACKTSSKTSSSALVQVILDPEKHRPKHVATREGADTVISITVAGSGFYRLEIDSLFSDKTKDFVTGGEFISVLSKRLTSVAQMRGSMRNPLLTAYLLQHYDAMLRALRLPNERLSRSPSRTKSIRQHSPVKALASLFGGSNRHAPAESTSSASTSIPFVARPNLGPKFKSESKIERLSEALTKSTSIATIVPNESNATNLYPTSSLEAALETLVLGLRARKGNVIGRIITNRSAADEASVNLLYNGLLEQPEDHEQVAQAPVDALFAAFEKFLKVAWRETLGPILDTAILDELQTKSCTLSPIDFEELLTTKIDEMTPQNRRAFRVVVGMLVDLLDGTGNDGDRGALMATVTEIMVCEGNPHDYMSLFDRLVEEHDVILNEAFHSNTPYYGSTAARSTTTATGSLSSKASSFGKRLGFGSLGRKGSKTDVKPGSQAAPNNTHSLLGRSRSIDWGKNVSSLSRPTSKDQPAASDNGSRPGTGKSLEQPEPIEPLKQSGLFAKASAPRKKRRSSLSDIDTLPSVNTSPFWNSPGPRRPEQSPLVSRNGVSPLRPGTPSILSRPRPRLDVAPSPPSSSHSSFLGRAAQSGYATVTPSASPTRSNAVRHRALTKKENQAPPIPTTEMSPPSSNHTLGRAQSTQIRHQRILSNLSPVKAPLSERPGSGNTPPPPLSLPNSRNPSDKDAVPSKLRTPSPFPLKALQARPRAQTTTQVSHQTSDIASRVTDQETAISQAESGLLVELAKIGQEMAAVPFSPTRMGSRREDGMKQVGGTGTTPRKENIEGRLRALEAKVPHLFRGLAERTRVLEEEVRKEIRERDERIRELEGQLQR